jgi:nitroreductase
MLIVGVRHSDCSLKELARLAGTQEEDTVTFPDALRLLELFHARDYAQARPHLYFKSLKSDTWVRPKGMRVLPSDLGIAILDVENEEWETIPFRDVSFGLW